MVLLVVEVVLDGQRWFRGGACGRKIFFAAVFC